MLPTGAQAQTGEIVVFEDLRGGQEIEGAVSAFDGQTYRIQTSTGEVSLDKTKVRCRGAACPEGPITSPPYRIATHPGVGARMLPDLMSGFGHARNFGLVRTVSASGTQAFELQKDNAPPLTWTVQTGTDQQIIDAILNRNIDFGIISGPHGDALRGTFKGRGLGDLDDPANSTALGLEIMIPIVSPTNTARVISDEHLAAVIAGEISDWKDLGQEPGPIRVFISRANDMAARVLHRNLSGTLSVRAKGFATDAAVADAVVSDDRAIGLIGATALRNARALDLQDSCGNPMDSDAFAALAGTYPYVKRLRAVRSDLTRTASTDAFWDYLQSDAADPYLTYAGYVPASVKTRALGQMGARMASAVMAPQTEVTLPRLRAMMTILQGADRLSSTFRFRAGSPRLDRTQEEELARLLEFLAANKSGRHEVILAGFTDSIGTAETNEERSLQEANRLREMILKAAGGRIPGLTVSAHGFGEIAPVICNDHEANRTINRRVEVWLR